MKSTYFKLVVVQTSDILNNTLLQNKQRKLVNGNKQKLKKKKTGKKQHFHEDCSLYAEFLTEAHKHRCICEYTSSIYLHLSTWVLYWWSNCF